MTPSDRADRTGGATGGANRKRLLAAEARGRAAEAWLLADALRRQGAFDRADQKFLEAVLHNLRAEAHEAAAAEARQEPSAAAAAAPSRQSSGPAGLHRSGQGSGGPT